MNLTHRTFIENPLCWVRLCAAARSCFSWNQAGVGDGTCTDVSLPPWSLRSSNLLCSRFLSLTLKHSRWAPVSRIGSKKFPCVNNRPSIPFLKKKAKCRPPLPWPPSPAPTRARKTKLQESVGPPGWPRRGERGPAVWHY